MIVHECPADEKDYEHSLQGEGGIPLSHITAWTTCFDDFGDESACDDPEAQRGSDECEYDADGRLTSLEFVREHHEANEEDGATAAVFDEYVEAGVLVLVDNGQAMQDGLNELAGNVRGSMNISLTAEDREEALNRTDGLSVEAGSCRLEVEAAISTITEQRESCAVLVRQPLSVFMRLIVQNTRMCKLSLVGVLRSFRLKPDVKLWQVTAWSLLFCLAGFMMCLHFARVLYSLALMETPAAPPTATLVPRDTPAPRREPAADAPDAAADDVDDAPWRAAWREAKNRPIRSGGGMSHVELEDIEMESTLGGGMDMSGGAVERRGTPEGRAELEPEPEPEPQERARGMGASPVDVDNGSPAQPAGLVGEAEAAAAREARISAALSAGGASAP